MTEIGRESLARVKTLGDLCDTLNNAEDGSDFDLSDLPTFGGAAPEKTTGAWSWDEWSLMMIDDEDRFVIVDRP